MRTVKGSVIALSVLIGLAGLGWYGHKRESCNIVCDLGVPTHIEQLEGVKYHCRHAPAHAYCPADELDEKIDAAVDDYVNSMARAGEEGVSVAVNGDTLYNKVIAPLVKDIPGDVSRILADEFSKMPTKEKGMTWDQWGDKMDAWGDGLEKRMDEYGAKMEKKAAEAEKTIKQYEVKK